MSATEKDDKTALFETYSVPKALATMALPAIASQFVAIVYNIVDVWCIGRTNNPAMIGASSLVAILYLLLVALANLFGSGGGSLIARQLGKGDREQARKTASYSIVMGAFAGLCFSLFCLVAMNPFLRALGAGDSTLGFARQYTFFAAVCGGIPIVLGCVLPMVMRNAGLPKEAGIGVALCGLVNIVLDPLFMFVIFPDGYQLLASGLAIMLSYVVAVAFFLVIFRKNKDTTILEIPRRLEKIDADSMKSLYSVGIPAGLAFVLFNSLGVVLNRLAASYGDITLAAVGIITKLERLPQNIGIAICVGMVPLVAYNFSKRDFQRMDRFNSAARAALLALGIFCTVLFLFCAEPIVGAFIDNEETVRLGTMFLRARALCIPFMLMGFQYVYYMQAIDQGTYSLLLTVIRHLVLSIPIMVALNALFGLDGLVWSQPVADVINVALNFALYRHVRRAMAA